MNMDKNMRDEIARVAYGFYEKRGCVSGNDFLDWLEAEKIVKQKYSKESTTAVKSIKSTQLHKAIESAKAKSRGLFTRPSSR